MREGLQDRWHMAGTVVCGVSCGICAAAQAYILATLVAGAFGEGTGLDGRQGLLALLMAVILLRGGLAWMEESFALSLGGEVQQSLRRRLLEKIDAMGPVKMRSQKYGELMTMLTEGLDTLETYYQKYMPQLFKSAVLPIAFLVIIFPLDWQTGLLMAITAPLVPVFMALIGQWTRSHTLLQWQALTRMGGHFQDVFEGLSTLKLFNRTEGQRRKIAALSEDFRSTNLQVLKWGFLSALVLEMLTTISIALISVGLGLRLVYGAIDFRSALFLLFLAPEFYLPLRSLSTQYHNSLNGAAAAKSMFALLAQEDGGIGVGTAAFDGDAAIEFDNVSFAYEEGAAALDRVSFSLKAGEKLGLVGASGSGKTTLMHMLAGFLRPDSGAITMGGQPLGDLGATALRHQIAFVTQDPYLFKGTVMDNIRVGNCKASDEEVVSLCRDLGAHDLFCRLAQGYETPVGQGGQSLSGGERQMLAIARACLKDAPVVLLDEATRNVDWENDCLLQLALARLSKGKTVIAIAHRLQTLGGMDKILVMEYGQVIQFGKASELQKQLGISAGAAPAAPATAIEEPAVAIEAPTITHEAPSAAPETPHVQASAQGAAVARMLGLCRRYAAIITGSCVLSASAIIANIALLGFSSYLISCASLQPPLLDLMTAIVAVRFFGISRAVLRYAERYISHDVTFRILSNLRLWYYDQMEKLSYVSLQKLGMGRVFKHIIEDVDVLKYFYLRALTVPAQALFVWVLVSVFLCFFSWKLAFALSAFFVLGGLVFPYMLRMLLAGKRTDLSAHRQGYSEAVYDYINGMADQQVYGTASQRLSSIEGYGRAAAQEQRYIGVWNSFAAVLSSLLANLALFASLVIMAPLVAEGKVSSLLLASVIWAVWASFESLQPVAAMTEYLDQSRGAMAGMDEAASRPQEHEYEGKGGMPSEEGLSAAHLCFAYEKGEALLNDISFTLKPGSKTALLGRSGAGKTTLLNLLIGFLPYDKGGIKCGGVELKDIDRSQLRQHIGYLEQRPYIFHDSIRGNILIAKEGASEQELHDAVAKARLDEFIEELPEGYNTLVGENGYKLSAGQRQRLALARLFLQDAPLVILDEATQSLDAENRDSIFSALSKWWVDKTILYVTHDSYGLSTMDNILFMEHGRIVEHGTEAELLKSGGRYAQMHDVERSFFGLVDEWR